MTKRLSFPANVAPEHIKDEKIQALIEVLEDALVDNPAIQDALNACDLEPTTRARWWAAVSAVSVLLAHECGQEVARNDAADEGSSPNA